MFYEFEMTSNERNEKVSERHYSFFITSLSSATSSIISRLVTHPLDTAKARLQVPISVKNCAFGSNMMYNGISDVIKKTYMGEGVKGLYRGFGVILVGGTPGTMIYLGCYEKFRDKIDFGRLEQNFITHFASGILAETVACIIYVPVDVIKERLQVQSLSPKIHANEKRFTYTGSFDAATKIMKYEGLRGLYKGYIPTLVSFGPYSALYFMFYEMAKDKVSQFNRSRSLPSDLLFWQIVCVSAGSGALASWLTSPLDLAKLRLQIQRSNYNKGSSTEVLYKGIADCLYQAYNLDGGLRGLFRGALARVIHFVPSITITMSCYETFRPAFSKMFNDQ